MDRLDKPIEFLNKLGLTDSDYQDTGMINHIADLLIRYKNSSIVRVETDEQAKEALKAYMKENKLSFDKLVPIYGFSKNVIMNLAKKGGFKTKHLNGLIFLINKDKIEELKIN